MNTGHRFRILRHLRHQGSITSWEAIKEYGIQKILLERKEKMNWIQQLMKTDEEHRLRCRCGFHCYRWHWRKLGKICIYCGHKKGRK